MIERLLDEAAERRALGDVRGAIEACEKAIAVAPSDARGYSRLGHLALDAFDYDKARDAFARASRLAPGDIGYRNNYGMLLIYAGDFSGAHEQFRGALAIDPTCIPAYYNIAPIAPATEAGALADALERLKAGVRSPLERSLAGFALGKLYDDLGDFDRAFENYREGNQEKRAQYDHAQTLSFFEASKAAFATPGAVATIADRPPFEPIFIVGMPRSGSTLIEELLARRADVTGLGERSEFPALMAALGRRHPSRRGYPGCAPHLAAEQLREIAVSYIDSVRPQAGSAVRAIDKQLMNFQFFPMLKRVFPAASVIHCTRDPIDTCLSAYFTNFQTLHAYSFDLGNVGLYYRAYRDLMNEWERLWPGAMINVRYEQLVQSKDGVLLDLQLGLGLTTGQTPEGPADRDVRTSSAWQVRQPVYTHAVARWKNYEKHLGPLIDALGDLAV